MVDARRHQRSRLTLSSVGFVVVDVVVIVEVAVAEKGGEHVSYETAACGCLPSPTVRSSVYAPWHCHRHLFLSGEPKSKLEGRILPGRSDVIPLYRYILMYNKHYHSLVYTRK